MSLVWCLVDGFLYEIVVFLAPQSGVLPSPTLVPQLLGVPVASQPPSQPQPPPASPPASQPAAIQCARNRIQSSSKLPKSPSKLPKSPSNLPKPQVQGCFAQTNPVSFLLYRSVFVCVVFLTTLAFQYAGAKRLTGGRSGRRFAPPSGWGSFALPLWKWRRRRPI